jgi:hypothetical protein
MEFVPGMPASASPHGRGERIPTDPGQVGLDVRKREGDWHCRAELLEAVIAYHDDGSA